LRPAAHTFDPLEGARLSPQPAGALAIDHFAGNAMFICRRFVLGSPTSLETLDYQRPDRVALREAGLDRHPEADRVRADALEVTRRLLGDDHPAVAGLLHDQAVSLHRQHRLDEAFSVVLDAVARRRELLGPEDPDLAASLLELARIQQDRGKLDDARSAAREAMAIWSKAAFVEPAVLLRARQLVGTPPRVVPRHVAAQPG